MKNVLCIIQSRLGSARLPEKALSPISGKPMIVHVVERVQKVSGLKIIVAVPTEDYSTYLELWSRWHWLCGVGDGETKNVWQRFVDVIQRYDVKGCLDTIVRVTGDCPLILPDVIQRMLKEFEYLNQNDPFAFLSNDTTLTGYPDGTDVEIFAKSLFLTSPPLNPDEEEHVTLSMKRNLPSIKYFSPLRHWPSVKLSVDTQEDLDRVRMIYRYCQDDPPIREDELCKVIREMKNKKLI